MKIKELLDILPNHEFLEVNETFTIPKLVELVLSHPNVRSIYVKDNTGKILGEISLGKLIKNVTIKKQLKCKISTRQLLSCITCRNIKDLIGQRLVFATPEEDASKVLMKAIKHGIKEIPILDENGKIIKNIGILDLWATIEKLKEKN